MQILSWRVCRLRVFSVHPSQALTAFNALSQVKDASKTAGHGGGDEDTLS
jgi:hypothetical protein